MENRILVDYFSFTSKYSSPQDLVKLLGLNKDNVRFVESSGARGYKNKLYFEGINIFYNHSINEDCWVEMSGSGCRAFETFSDSDFYSLSQDVLAEPDNYHLTRLDLAYDDFNKTLDLNKIKREIKKHNYVSHIRYWECTDSSKGICCYLGSPSSDLRFRIYDKKQERNREDLEHWIRWEIQLRDEHSSNCLQSILFSEDVGAVFAGVLLQYVRFVVPDETQTNVSRLKTQKWYSDFIGQAEAVKLWTPSDMEYNLFHCERYVYKQAGNAISALIQIKGIDTFQAELQKEKSPITAKYTDLINNNRKDSILEYLEEHGVKS